MSKSLEDKNSGDWTALHYAQALLGLQRLCKAKAIDLDPKKSKDQFDTVTRLLDRLTKNPGDIKRIDADQGWDAQEIANAMGALGDLLVGDPPALAVTEQAKSAAGKLISLMGMSLKDKTHRGVGERSSTPKRCSACSGCARPMRSIWQRTRRQSNRCSIVLRRIPAASRVPTLAEAGMLERSPVP